MLDFIRKIREKLVLNKKFNVEKLSYGYIACYQGNEDDYNFIVYSLEFVICNHVKINGTPLFVNVINPENVYYSSDDENLDVGDLFFLPVDLLDEFLTVDEFTSSKVTFNRLVEIYYVLNEPYFEILRYNGEKNLVLNFPKKK